jgi:hypothetical protein
MSLPLNVITMAMAKTDSRIAKLECRLAALVEERQSLRAHGAEPSELERNRREIVVKQQELSEALISTYAPQLAFA